MKFVSEILGKREKNVQESQHYRPLGLKGQGWW